MEPEDVVDDDEGDQAGGGAEAAVHGDVVD